MLATATGEFAISTPGLGAALRFVEAITALWGVPLASTRALCVILDESVGNLLLHDDTVGAEHRLVLTLERQAAAVRMTIADPGAAFDPTAHRVEGERELGGLGLLLTRGLAREIAYDRQGGANQLTVWVDDPA